MPAFSLPILMGAVLLGMLVVMTAAWLTQRALKDTGWVDVFWTFGTGLAGMIVALWPVAGYQAAFLPRQALVGVLAALWAIRLGGYIGARVASADHEDARYVRLRAQWGAGYDARLFWFLQVQALVSTLLCLAIALAARAPEPAFGLRDFAAVLVWLAAVGGETLADGQMRRFKTDPANRGRICDRGLWSWSRHPNYFFEWLGWFAYPVLAVHLNDSTTFAALLAPAVMYLVLRFGSGVPPLEQSMLESRGDAFRAYQARTSAFLPFPPRSA